MKGNHNGAVAKFMLVEEMKQKHALTKSKECECRTNVRRTK